MITDNFYIEKILSNYFNDLGSNYNSARKQAYIAYNYCLEKDGNLNNKIKFAIATSFMTMRRNIPKFKVEESTKAFLLMEELFEHIDETLELLNSKNEPFITAIQQKNKTAHIRLQINKKMALH